MGTQNVNEGLPSTPSSVVNSTAPANLDKSQMATAADGTVSIGLNIADLPDVKDKLFKELTAQISERLGLKGDVKDIDALVQTIRHRDEIQNDLMNANKKLAEVETQIPVIKQAYEVQISKITLNNELALAASKLDFVIEQKSGVKLLVDELQAKYNIYMENGEIQITNKDGSRLMNPSKTQALSTNDIILESARSLKLVNTPTQKQNNGFQLTPAQQFTQTSTRLNSTAAERAYNVALENLSRLANG